MATFQREVEIKKVTLSVEFDVDNVKWDNDGIGHYEFWGAKCFDKGRDYVSEFDINDLKVFSEKKNEYVNPSQKLKDAIEKALYDDDGLYEDVAEHEGNQREAMEDYYADQKYEMSRGN